MASTGGDAAQLTGYRSPGPAGITGTSLTIDCGYLTAAEWHSDKTFFQENV